MIVKGIRNYCLEARNNVNKQSKNIKDVTFVHSYYDKLDIPKNSIIYCDPPYNTKATKGKYKDNFDTPKFWEWCREKFKEGHKIFISEYNAPEDFTCIWQKELNQRMNNNNSKGKKSVEKLFTLN